MKDHPDTPAPRTKPIRKVLIGFAVVGVVIAVYFVGCTGKDHRKLFSELRGTINKSQDHDEIKKHLLEFTPVGTDRKSVQEFLSANLRQSAVHEINSSPNLTSHPEAASTIWIDLWVRYVFIFGQYETFAVYVFDENDELMDLIVSTADSFL